MTDYVKVTTTDALPEGQCRSFEVAGRHIALFNVGGTFHALDDACIHRGGPLGEGDLDGEVVTCPWHGWQWNVCTGQNPRSPDVRIDTYPVRVIGADVEIGL